MKNKKGMSLGEGFPAVLMLVLVSLIVIIAIYIFMTLTGNMPGTSVTTINESGTLVAAGYVLQNSTSCGAESPSIVYILNSTDGTIIPAANYTLTNSGGTWTVKNATAYSTATASIVYTWLWGGPACVAATTSAIQFGTYPALIGLVGTLIFLALVIGTLIGAFAGSTKGV
jgi:hypothetical protein